MGFPWEFLFSLKWTAVFCSIMGFAKQANNPPNTPDPRAVVLLPGALAGGRLQDRRPGAHTCSSAPFHANEIAETARGEGAAGLCPARAASSPTRQVSARLSRFQGAATGQFAMIIQEPKGLKYRSQGLNLCHGSDPRHSSDITRSSSARPPADNVIFFFFFKGHTP